MKLISMVRLVKGGGWVIAAAIARVRRLTTAL